jgi:hypothetical protein
MATDKYLPVPCKLRDCVFFHIFPDDPATVYCKHTDKEAYPRMDPCPLYRIDWMKKAGSSQNYLNMFNKKK